MNDDQAHCACNRVKYSPVNSTETPGALVERWVCEDCGSEFVRAGAVAQAVNRAHEGYKVTMDRVQRSMSNLEDTLAQEQANVRSLTAKAERAEELRVSTARQLAQTQEARDTAQAKVYAMADLILEGDRYAIVLLRSLGINVKPDGDQWCATYHNTFRNPQASAIGYGPTPLVAADILLSQLARVDLGARGLVEDYKAWSETREQFISEDVIEGFSDLIEVIDRGMGLGMVRDQAEKAVCGNCGGPARGAPKDGPPCVVLREGVSDYHPACDWYTSRDKLEEAVEERTDADKSEEVRNLDGVRTAALLGIEVARMQHEPHVWAASMPGFPLDGDGNLSPRGVGPTAMCAVQALVGDLVTMARAGVDGIGISVRYHNRSSQWVATLVDGGLCDPHGRGDTPAKAGRVLIAELVRRSRDDEALHVAGIREEVFWMYSNLGRSTSTGDTDTDKVARVVLAHVLDVIDGSTHPKGEPRTCDNCGLTDAEREREYQAGREAGKPRAWCARDTLGLPLPPCCDAWEHKVEACPPGSPGHGTHNDQCDGRR